MTFFIVVFFGAIAFGLITKWYKDIYLFNKKNKKLNKQWKAISKGYQGGDFGAVKKAIGLARKLDDDPLLKLIEAQMFLYGWASMKNPVKTKELLEEISKKPLPKKYPEEEDPKYKGTHWFIKLSLKYFGKNPYKMMVDRKKKVKKRQGGEAYLKKVKGLATKMWNEHDLWSIEYTRNVKLYLDEVIDSAV